MVCGLYYWQGWPLWLCTIAHFSFCFQVGGRDWKVGGGACGAPKACCGGMWEGSPTPAGGVWGPPTENFENLHVFWCNLAHSRPHFLCPDICYFLLPSVYHVKLSAGKEVNSAAVCRFDGYSAVQTPVRPNFNQHMVLVLHWQQAISEGISMGFAVRVRSAGKKYGPTTSHQRDRADVTEFVTLVRLLSLGQHIGVLALAGYKRRKSALTAGPIVISPLLMHIVPWVWHT